MKGYSLIPKTPPVALDHGLGIFLSLIATQGMRTAWLLRMSVIERKA
ncbi:hypothetical protein Thivi_3389 [Thiocystis violascens DSM 198]|uniref:Uncharacterized protein n=1 Tax=Thiocystis violascens (strain ATCC 17096 / DSM 198 / 6111) TaxID=765911 RepID=I3YE41_THIV6|nr:hypothetical protein Thivi_3389 [Thiocystis violascens DSM 198]